MKACTQMYQGTKGAQSTSLGLFESSYREMRPRSRRNIASFFNKQKGTNCYDPAYGFEAFAVASLDSANPSRLDIWKINRDGDLLQLQNGLPFP